MATAQNVLDVARSQLGITEVPFGSNCQPYGIWYVEQGFGGEAFRATAWCAQFVSYCAWKAGAADVVPMHAYTPSGAAWFKARGAWGHTPRVGAIVYYDWGTRIAHVGIVEAVYADGSWIAIEGNTDERGGRTGGKVMRQHRRGVGRTGGFGYPAYDGVDVLPSPIPNVDRVRTLLRKGDSGPDVVELQRKLLALGYPLPKYGADGEYGDETEAAVRMLQEAANITVDGIAGPQVAAAIARGVRKVALRPAALVVDGELGPKTISRWQEVVGTPVDGVISPGYSVLVAKVQDLLNRRIGVGLRIDGQGIRQNGREYRTTHALQRYLGFSRTDGRIDRGDSLTVRRLQERLNAGRF